MFISSFHQTENQNNIHYAERIWKTKEGTAQVNLLTEKHIRIKYKIIMTNRDYGYGV